MVPPSSAQNLWRLTMLESLRRLCVRTRIRLGLAPRSVLVRMHSRRERGLYTAYTMAHQSLYRAYRPQSFAEVVGQEQVTGPLAEAVARGKVGHAYLFAGSRGLGKTTVARILARELGCTEHDLYEVDAASNNSVEDMRTLTEGVYTLPFESPYKVYILDEVHMLSKSAWNAFLKTLEEPP